MSANKSRLYLLQRRIPQKNVMLDEGASRDKSFFHRISVDSTVGSKNNYTPKLGARYRPRSRAVFCDGCERDVGGGGIQGNGSADAAP